jgi:SAF domain
MAVASAVVVFASIAAFATIYSSANHQVEALIVTTTIEQGQPITASQLGQSGVAISGGVVAIPVSDASELSGKRAAVTIPAGSLLTPADVTSSQPIASGDAVVGMALKAGQLPAAGVSPGDQVMIVETASPGSPVTTTGSADSSSGASGASTGVLVAQASVFDVTTPPANASGTVSELVSVEVPSTLAAAVSTAAASGDVSLVLLPSISTTPSSGDQRGGTTSPGRPGTSQ